ncbi:MAG: hypothetical protein WCJ96_09880 [Verrucomicrobiota bacterium]
MPNPNDPSNGLAVLIGLKPGKGQSSPGGQPSEAPEACYISIPAKAVQVDGHAPSEGDSVELQVAGVVRKAEGDKVVVELRTANGSQIEEAEGMEPDERSDSSVNGLFGNDLADSRMMRAAEKADQGGVA